MQEWWENLSDVLRVLYCIAVPSTLILVLQLLLTMIGGHGDAGVEISDTSGIGDADFDADLDGNGVPDVLETSGVSDGGNPADFGSLRLLTLQTVVTFLAVFGWVSIICISSGMPVPAGGGIGLVCGLAMMFLVAKLVQASRKLAENGILNLRNAIGETATVYLTVPAKNGGSGKVTMRLQGRFGEFDAISDSDKPITNGTQVLVTDVRGDELVVEEND
ncbi:MAG: NfeD family protein [Oscillospiraceae bacterium]|nr:NfeD family protein [Oscillospiraceae bacterium]